MRDKLFEVRAVLGFANSEVFPKQIELRSHEDTGNFLNLPYFPHRFTDLDQIKVNGLSYNDNVVGNNMHTIRTQNVHKVDNPYKNMIPERFIKEYGHIRF